MEISSNNINQPVAFFPKNTGNTINMAIDDNQFYQSNIFSAQINEQLINNRKFSQPLKRKRKSRRLNTMDNEYLPDTAYEEETLKKDEDNFFAQRPQNQLISNIRKKIEYIIANIPLINYFYLQKKTGRIRETVEVLTDINQNVDELLNTQVPFGEEKEIYSSIEKNLTSAVNLIGRVNKNV